ncbi:lysophospholipid acyltransferase family protein [Alteribacillus iranensis]|uniref:1-acyl-sn-glycerol-3-phosphate acyltransferase n=1 Tax=Alteribacillus iranensis TaxID=930128 RepID=A0A1I1ZSI2_9BACI|nr:lysophospholipid acyltransferase family protein [Alteribacillus iranensis]SFE33593.1 1-acyl-sn-glycerol-3-phosphate acyltransferase [Alteribacillus iranensis]
MTLYKIGRLLCRIFFTVFFRVEIKGKENIPEDGSVLICSNHMSNLDPPLVGSFIKRKLNFMAKEELFNVALLGRLLPHLGAFPVKRGAGDRQALRKGLGLLNQGEVMCLFPEGTRSKTGEIRKGLSGSGFFALRSDAVVIPTLITGEYKLFRKITLIYGEPIDFQQLREEKKSAAEATDIIMKTIQRLKDHHEEQYR